MDRLVTEAYHSLPSGIREKLKEISTKNELITLLRWYFGRDNYFKKKGWFESERRGLPVDAEGNSIPWYSYPAIDFLETRLPKDLTVFEYGSGESSIWWAERTGHVTTVEDDTGWAEHVKRKAPPNLDVLFRDQKSEYVNSIDEVGSVDIVIIDGKWRPECFQPAEERLAEKGAIILDDAHWDGIRNEPAIEESGLANLPFYGPKALGAGETCTEIFYRRPNCLAI